MKRLRVIFSLFILILFFYSCNEEEKPELYHQIVGRWDISLYYEAYELDGYIRSQTYLYAEDSIFEALYFHDDGYIYIKDNESSIEEMFLYFDFGTWQIEDDKLKINQRDYSDYKNERTITEIYTLDESEFHFGLIYEHNAFGLKHEIFVKVFELTR